MQYIVGVVLPPVDCHPIVPEAVRDIGCHRRRDGPQILQIPTARLWKDCHSSVPIQIEIFDYPVDKCRSCHIAVWIDVHFPAQFVFDADVPFVGILHQMDCHTPHQFCNGVHRCTYFRIVGQARIALACQGLKGIRCTQPRRAPPLGRLSPCRLPASLTQSPHHSFPFLDFSIFSRYLIHANTEASKRSIRCSGCTLSYWIMSSVFSIAMTFSTQYSNASLWR